MILAVHSTYCQYPRVKKINQDSVVIMTLEQGKDINKSFLFLNNKIDSLKDTVFYYNKLKFTYDSLYQTIYQTKDSFYDWKWKYEANRRSYDNRQKDYWKTEKIHEASKLILIGIIILQFTTIGSLQNQINHR